MSKSSINFNRVKKIPASNLKINTKRNNFSQKTNKNSQANPIFFNKKVFPKISKKMK